MPPPEAGGVSPTAAKTVKIDISMYYTYVIKCQGNGKYYIGHTADIARRLKEHSQGKTRSLKNKGPFVLVHSENYGTKQDAYRRELQIKSYKGGEAFCRLISKEKGHK